MERAKQLDPQVDRQEFKALLESAVDIDPNNGEAHIYLGLFYFKEGDMKRACSELSDGLNIDCFAYNSKELAEQAYVALGKTFSRIGEKEMALMAFRSLIGLYPDSKISLRLAEQIYGKRSEVDPMWLEYYIRGCEAFADEQLEEAQELFEESENMNDSFPWTLYHLGLIDEINGDIDGATLKFLQAIEEERHYLFCNALARTCHSLGKKDEEKKCLNQTLALNRHYAGKILAQIKMALSKGDVDRAGFLAEIIHNQLPGSNYSEMADDAVYSYVNPEPGVQQDLIEPSGERNVDEQEAMFGDFKSEDDIFASHDEAVEPAEPLSAVEPDESSVPEIDSSAVEDIVEVKDTPVVRKISVSPAGDLAKPEKSDEKPLEDMVPGVLKDESVFGEDSLFGDDAESVESNGSVSLSDVSISDLRDDGISISPFAETDDALGLAGDGAEEDLEAALEAELSRGDGGAGHDSGEDASAVPDFDDALAMSEGGLSAMMLNAVGNIDKAVESGAVSGKDVESLALDVKEAVSGARSVLNEIRQLCKIQICAIKKQQELFLDAMRREVERVSEKACDSIDEIEKALEAKFLKSIEEPVFDEKLADVDRKSVAVDDLFADDLVPGAPVVGKSDVDALFSEELGKEGTAAVGDDELFGGETFVEKLEAELAGAGGSDWGKPDEDAFLGDLEKSGEPEAAVEEPVEEPKAEEPVEEPKVEEPVEEPKVEEPVEEPKAEEPVEEPKAEESVEEPKAEELVEEPKAEESVEEPKAEEPVEEPKAGETVEEPKAEESVEEPKAEESVEEPKPEESVEEPKPEESVEEPKPEELVEEPKPEESVEEPKAEESVEEPKAEESVEEPKAEEPVEEPKAEEPVEEPKAEEPVEEPKAEEPEVAVEEPEAAVEEPEAVVEEPEAVVEEPEAAVDESEAAVVEELEAVVEEPEAVIEELEAAVEELEADEEPDVDELFGDTDDFGDVAEDLDVNIDLDNIDLEEDDASESSVDVSESEEEAVAGEPVDDAADEPVGDAAEEPVGDVADEPVGDAADEPVGDVADEPVGDVADEPVGDAADEPVGDAADESVGDAAEESVDDVVIEIDDGIGMMAFGGAFDESYVDGAVEEDVIPAGSDIDANSIADALDNELGLAGASGDEPAPVDEDKPRKKKGKGEKSRKSKKR